jgi:hypothetical protein
MVPIASTTTLTSAAEFNIYFLRVKSGAVTTTNQKGSCKNVLIKVKTKYM